MAKVSENITIFWFRQDLRISDNPGLLAALKSGVVMPIYIVDSNVPELFRMGDASKWWLHQSINSLDHSLANTLNVYIGDPKEIFIKLIQDNFIKSIYWNRCYEPWYIKKDAELELEFKKRSIDCKNFNASLIREPWENLKNDGTPYKVFTAFFRQGYLKQPNPRQPLKSISNIQKKMLLKDVNNKTDIADLGLLSSVNWYKKIENYWEVGELAAKKKLDYFLKKGLKNYKENRNFPEKKENVSRLSPHLHFGEISPHQVWAAAQNFSLRVGLETDLQHFLSEIAWREFSYYLLYYFPELSYKNFQEKFDNFPWVKNKKALKAFQLGKTGYPIIDAGMRELWQTGYMHNRVRMIVASFLVKNLLIHWKEGAQWFWNCLVDADLANNSASWQWVAGSGADAAPYFRIFNPILQAQKFDPDGVYIRTWVPELALLAKPHIFKPWEAPPLILKEAGIILGKSYPKPIVDLVQTRKRALEAYSLLLV